MAPAYGAVMHHGDWNPWRELGRRAHLRVQWVDTRRRGCLNFSANTITMSTRMCRAERRSVLTHELFHDSRGTFPLWFKPREEAIVREASARRLIPIHELTGVLRWAHDVHEAADALDVDVPTFTTRLERLVHPAEMAAVRRIIAARDDLP